MSVQGDHWRERIHASRGFILAGALLAALLPLGGVRPIFLLPGIAAAMAARIATSLSRHEEERSRAAELASAALWLGVAIPTIQLVPLPRGVLRVVSPRANDIWAQTERLIGSYQHWRPISVDPPGTAFMVATAIVCALTFDAWSRAARTRPTSNDLLRAIGAVPAAFAVIGLLHTVTGMTRLYGIYQPQMALVPPVLSPLLNPNHASAMAGAGVPLWLGLFVAARTTPQKTVAAVLAAVCGAVALLMISRSGIAVVLAEIVAMAIVVRFRKKRRGETSSRRLMLAIGAIGALTIVGAFWVGLGQIVKEASDTDISKTRIALRAYGIVSEFAIAGAGRGTFGAVFDRYQGDLNTAVRFTHVEHWPAQLLIELGVLGTIAFVTLLALSLRRVLRPHSMDAAVLGAAVALGGFVVHDLADFSMEFAGVGAFASALLAIVTAREPRAAKKTAAADVVTEPVSPNPRSRAAALGVSMAMGVAALVLAVGVRTRTQGVDESRLSQAWRDGRLTDEPTEAALLRHPANAYIAMVEAVRRVRTTSAGSAFVHAIELGPGRAQTHFWFARWLMAASLRGQSLAEYREAVRLSGGLAGAAVNDLLRAEVDIYDLDSVCITEGAANHAAGALDALGRSEDAAFIDESQLFRFPPAIVARRRRAERARLQGHLDEARAEAHALVDVAKTAPDGWMLLAYLAATPEEAEAALEQGMVATNENLQVMRELIRRKGIRLGVEGVAIELERYRDKLLASGKSVAEEHALMGDIELTIGHRGAALRHYRDAAAASNSPLDYDERVARLAEQLGQFHLAVEAWSALAVSAPDKPDYAANAARVRAAAQAAAASAILRHSNPPTP